MQSLAVTAIASGVNIKHSIALCGHGNFTMSGAKTARVARVGQVKTERRRGANLIESPVVFTLNSGYYRRWRL